MDESSRVTYYIFVLFQPHPTDNRFGDDRGGARGREEEKKRDRPSASDEMPAKSEAEIAKLTDSIRELKDEISKKEQMREQLKLQIDAVKDIYTGYCLDYDKLTSLINGGMHDHEFREADPLCARI